MFKKAKTLFTYVLLVSISAVFSACPGPKPTLIDYKKNPKEYVVRKAINGNTIILKNGLKVKLLGIKDDPRSFSYLRQELTNKKVRLTADSKHKNSFMDATKDSVWAHVRLVVSANKSIALNGEMLLRGDAKYSASPNNDSARIYKEYADREPSVVMTDEQLCLHMTPATFLVDIGGQGIGTGFFISDDGLALTNNHVMNRKDNPDFYTVYLSDDKGNISETNKRRVSRILYTDQANDFTIFRVQLDPNETVPCLFVSRTEPIRGEHVGVVGNPRGLTATFSTGEFSAFREPTTIQFTAPIYQGNSGGPICNRYGIVIV